MKRYNVVVLFITMLVWCNQTFAAGDIYFGVKGGLVQPDSSVLDDTVNAGIYLGYNISDTGPGTLAAEGEFTTTLVDGDISGGGDWDIDTLGIYGVFKTKGDVYFKGKAGLVNLDPSTSFGNLEDDTEFSYGFGIGVTLGNGHPLEIEYTVLEDDLTFLSVGYLF